MYKKLGTFNILMGKGMKRLLQTWMVLITLGTVAQEHQELRTSAREVEAKAAGSRMAFRANPNTGNYDVKYHRLELTVDPSQAQIDGDVTTYFEAKAPMGQIHFDLADNMTV